MIHTNHLEEYSKDDELKYRSLTNLLQFSSLAHKLKNADIENEILNNKYFKKKVSRAKNYSNVDVSQWLKNSWNTESILAQNRQIIKNTNQSFCMQWAFPQAYYAVFGNILAMFKAIGQTETSHTAVLKKYSSLMQEGKFPVSISMCCDGTKKNKQYHNITLPENHLGNSTVHLDLDDNDTIDYYICQFLRATRDLRLIEKAPKMNFKNQKGDKRKKLTETDWGKVSDAIGATTILDFLYRKRIKGNYQDIETYNCPHFDGRTILRCLLNTVDRLNLVTETYISKAIGIDEFSSIAKYHLNKVKNKKLEHRICICEDIYNACG